MVNFQGRANASTRTKIYNRYIEDFGYFPPEPPLRRVVGVRELPLTREQTHGDQRSFGAAQQNLVWNENVQLPGQPGGPGAWIPESQDEVINRIYEVGRANEEVNARLRGRLEETLGSLESQAERQKQTLQFFGGE